MVFSTLITFRTGKLFNVFNTGCCPSFH